MNPPAEPAAQTPPPDNGVPFEALAKEELAKAKALADENMAGWKRAMADYANLKRENERAATELAKYAIAGFVEKLLPVVESFRKAADSRPAKNGEPLDETRVKQWVDGIGHVRSQLESALVSAGVTSIDKDGVPFDPALHDAMMMEKREGVAAGTVTKVLEPGCKLHDRVIRPAKVVVAE